MMIISLAVSILSAGNNNRFIELYEESKLSALIPLFLAHVIQFIRETETAGSYDQHSYTKEHQPGVSEHLVSTLRQTCVQLVQIVTFAGPLGHAEHDGNAAPVNWSLARQITAKLGQVFVAIVDTFVGKEIQVQHSQPTPKIRLLS